MKTEKGESPSVFYLNGIYFLSIGDGGGRTFESCRSQGVLVSVREVELE